MEKKIEVYNKKVSYFLKKSNRAKRMRIAIYHDSKVIVTVPKNLHDKDVEKYIIHKSKWIDSKLSFYKNFRNTNHVNFNDANLKDYKKQALTFVEVKLRRLQSKYKFTYNTILIKNQKTIWGSCSKKNNLSFNFKIAILKPKIRDYVIVHEFCHLKIKNHSRKFWILVENIMPEYRKIKRELHISNLSLI